MTTWIVIAATLFACALAVDPRNTSQPHASWGSPPHGYTLVETTTYKLVPDPTHSNTVNFHQHPNPTPYEPFYQDRDRTHPSTEHWQCSNCHAWHSVRDIRTFPSNSVVLLRTDVAPTHMQASARNQESVRYSDGTSAATGFGIDKPISMPLYHSLSSQPVVYAAPVGEQYRSTSTSSPMPFSIPQSMEDHEYLQSASSKPEIGGVTNLPAGDSKTDNRVRKSKSKRGFKSTFARFWSRKGSQSETYDSSGNL